LAVTTLHAAPDDISSSSLERVPPDQTYQHSHRIPASVANDLPITMHVDKFRVTWLQVTP